MFYKFIPIIFCFMASVVVAIEFTNETTAEVLTKTAGSDKKCWHTGCDSAERKLVKKKVIRVNQQMGKHNALNERVVVHFDAIEFRKLFRLLVPKDWRIKFDIPEAKVDYTLIFHAETTRRHAMDQLLSQLGFEGIFYQGMRIVLVAGGREQ